MSQLTSTPSALLRSPRRITITLALRTYEQLQQRCDQEGRSLSNLAAFLLETSLHHNGHAMIPAASSGPPSDRRSASPVRR